MMLRRSAMLLAVWAVVGALVMMDDTTTVVKALSTTTTRKTFPGLDAAAFRHGFDRGVADLVQRVPVLSTVAADGIRRVLAVAEEGVRLDLLASSVQVNEEQLPRLYELLQEACTILDLPEVPDLYVQSNSVANAYTIALREAPEPLRRRSNSNKKDSSKSESDDDEETTTTTTTTTTPRKPIVVVTSALVDRCTDAEMQAILGHELGHLKCEHSVYLSVGSLLATPLTNIPIVGSQTQKILQDWRLAAEYSCDRAALLVAQDAQVVNGAMLKLVSGTAGGGRYDDDDNTANNALNVEAFVKQCQEYDQQLKNANPLVRASIQNQQRTHPLPIRRVAALQDWSQSSEYKRILRWGTPMMDTKEENEEETKG